MEGGEGLAGPDQALDLDEVEADARAEEALHRFLPDRDPVVVRSHTVTALVVAHEGAPWLPRTLAALSAQLRAPDRVVGVDTGSSDDSPALLRAALPLVLGLDSSIGLADALGAAVAADLLRTGDPIGQPAERGADLAARSGAGSYGPGPAAAGRPDATHWYWIVHDDSAPEPGCLEQLLLGADRNPGAHVLVPKAVAWSDPAQLVGIGHRWAPGTPVVERLEPRERDQGQYDVDRPVYCGDSAGMLVRADVWQALGGMDPLYGDWAAAADLCRRVWGSGGEVMFLPHATVAHRRAGHRGVRRGVEARPVPRRATRSGQLLLELTQAPLVALPWRWLRAWASTLVRWVALLLTREPEEATAELVGAVDVLARPGRVRAGRRALRLPPVTDRRRPAHVRAPRGAAISHSVYAWLAAIRRAGRSGSAWRPTRRLWPPLAVAGVLAVLAVVRDPGALFGSGTLRGGGLLPAPGATEVLGDYLASWQDARFGSPTLQPAYLPLLAAASVPLLGSVDLLLRLLVGLAVPLAFLSAYLSIGPALVGRHRIELVTEHRMALALAWATLPAGVAAMSAGRISTLALLLLGPPTARLLVRALAAARAPGTGVRPALAAGTMLGVTVAFAPLVYALVAGAAVAGWVALGRPAWPVRTAMVTLGVAAVFPLLWAPRVAVAPVRLLTDLGRSDASLAEPVPWVLGLSPGGPTALPWPGVPLVVAAVLAVLLLTPTRRMVAGLAAALGLLVGVAWTPALVGAVWPEVDPGMLWPGQALLVAGGLLAVLLARVAARRGRRRRIASTAWLVCVVVLVVGWWLAPSVMTVRAEGGLPPVVALAGQTPERPRALVLSRASDAVRYGVAATAQSELGDADALVEPNDDPAFADVVQALVSGAGGDMEADLGGRGIRYVVFDGDPADLLVGELDAAVGLRRLASSAEQSLWLVAGDPMRAELVGRTDDPDVAVPVGTDPTSIDVVLHPQALLPRTLQLAERYDAGWRARITDEGVRADLDLQAGGQGMLTGEVTGTGWLSVHHRSPWTTLALAHLVAMVGLVVLALPKRRTVDLDGEAVP